MIFDVQSKEMFVCRMHYVFIQLISATYAKCAVVYKQFVNKMLKDVIMWQFADLDK